MTDARAAVHVVGVQHRAGKLLHHVVGFIAGAARGAGGHDRPRPVLRFNAAEPVGGVADRLFPGNGGEGFAFAVADHGLGKAGGEKTGIVEEVPAVKPFQT